MLKRIDNEERIQNFACNIENEGYLLWISDINTHTHRQTQANKQVSKNSEAYIYYIDTQEQEPSERTTNTGIEILYRLK